jgi:hypothetical protein
MIVTKNVTRVITLEANLIFRVTNFFSSQTGQKIVGRVGSFA